MGKRMSASETVTLQMSGRAYGTIQDTETNIWVQFPADVNREEATENLEDCQADFVQAGALLVGAVGTCRAAGMSWAEVGKVLGITGQGARARYGARLGDG